MKNLIISLIAVFAVASLYGQQNSNEDQEKEVIIKLINEETQSYYDRDMKRWSGFYVQSDDDFWIWSGDNSHGYRDNWPSHKEQMSSSFETEKEPNLEKKKPIRIRVYDKSAWIVFENEVFDEKGESLEKSHVTYFLEKPDQDWKIIYTNRVYTSSYYLADWPSLNMIAYAKSLGKGPEDVGNYYYENYKEDFDPELGYDGYQDIVVNNFTNRTPPDGMKIIEQDDDHVVFTASGFATNLKQNGSLNNVTYQEYLTLDETFWSLTGDRMGATYKQEITDDGLKVSISKKQ